MVQALNHCWCLSQLYRAFLTSPPHPTPPQLNKNKTLFRLSLSYASSGLALGSKEHLLSFMCPYLLFVKLVYGKKKFWNFFWFSKLKVKGRKEHPQPKTHLNSERHASDLWWNLFPNGEASMTYSCWSVNRIQVDKKTEDEEWPESCPLQEKVISEQRISSNIWTLCWETKNR